MHVARDTLAASQRCCRGLSFRLQGGPHKYLAHKEDPVGYARFWGLLQKEGFLQHGVFDALTLVSVCTTKQLGCLRPPPGSSPRSFTSLLFQKPLFLSLRIFFVTLG